MKEDAATRRRGDAGKEEMERRSFLPRVSASPCLRASSSSFRNPHSRQKPPVKMRKKLTTGIRASTLLTVFRRLPGTIT
jgi:hypothetical protein